MRRSTSRNGFTLLEVMVALAILAVALVALLGLRNNDVEMQTYARDVTRATLIAREMVLTADSGASDLGYSEGDFGTDHPGFLWRKQVTPFMAEFLGDRVREVRVTVLFGVPEDRSTAEEGRVEVSRFVEVR
jgi:general secretion pathway protein I